MPLYCACARAARTGLPSPAGLPLPLAAATSKKLGESASGPCKKTLGQMPWASLALQ